MDLGASLVLQGPPLAGVAEIHWHILSFTVHFGASNTPPAKLTWNQFADLIREPVGAPAAIALDTIWGQEMHTYTATSGLYKDLTIQPVSGVLPPSAGPLTTTSTTTETVPLPTLWTVDATTFAFSFASAFPLTSVSLNSDPAQMYTATPTYMKPMHIPSTANVTSTLAVTISSEETTKQYPGFGVSFVKKQVPVAIWGPCEYFQFG